MPDLARILAERGDLAHRALFLWAATASALLVFALREYAAAPSSFAPFRGYVASPPAPCDTCDYRSLCRGGCRAVAVHVTGDARQPDPECPRVMEFMTQREKVRLPVLG